MRNDSTSGALELARKKACEIASSLLKSDELCLDRILEMEAIGRLIYPEIWETEFHVFGVIASDTDHIPTSDVRQNFGKKWIQRCDIELKEIAIFYRKDVTLACQEVIAKHCSA